MPTTTVLNIGGVPEHFNLPWHLAMEEGRFREAGIDLRWSDCPGGTGEMTCGLAEGKLDLALPLSEGAVAAIARGVPMQILQWYVRSPLIWGIHVPAASKIRSVDSLKGKRFAISRYGSGSHLMAFVNAHQNGWTPSEDLRFVEVGDLSGATTSLKQGDAEGFLWERFSTQPYVDRGLMRRVGECPTPWPAFAIAASNRVLKESQEAVAALLRVINEVNADFKAREGIVDALASRYELALEQATEWFNLTEWADSSTVEVRQLMDIIATLDELNLLESALTPAACCAPSCTLIA